MVKITHYLSRVDLAHGGVVRAVLDMCQLVAAHGHQVTLITHDDTDVPESWRGPFDDQPTLLKVDPPQGPLGRFRAEGLAAVEAAIAAADVLHLHTPWETTNLQLGALARRHRVPYVLTVHGMLDDWSMQQRQMKKRLFLSLAGRRLLERAHRVHCTASAEWDQARRWIPRARGEVIPLVFDLSPYRQLPGPDAARQRYPMLNDDAPKVLFLSRLHVKKGVDRLIEAAALVHQRGHGFRLIIAGSGEDDYVSELAGMVDRHGLTDITNFTGLVVGEDKVSLYQAADCFVLPTSQENFGFVFPEALATSTPVVTTRGVDIWPELEQSGGALIVDRDPPAIAAAIIELIDDPKRRERMGESGRDWVLRTFDSEQILRQFVGMYEGARAGG